MTESENSLNHRILLVEERLRHKFNEMDKLDKRLTDTAEKQSDIREMVREMVAAVQQDLRDIRDENNAALRNIQDANRQELEAMAKLLQSEAAKIADERLEKREAERAKGRPNLFTQDRIIMGLGLLLLLFAINPDLAGLALKIFM